MRGGKALSHTINQTMMRVDLPKPLASGGKFTFQIDWWYNINDRLAIGGRSGYEHFEDEDNYLYTIAQFFPPTLRLLRPHGLAEQAVLGQLVSSPWNSAITM